MTVTGATGDILIQNTNGDLTSTGVISTQGGNITVIAADNLTVNASVDP